MEYEVEVIKAQEPKYKFDERQQTVRVCAYCRVSTKQDDQINSLDAQTRFFSEYIAKHSNWVNLGIYADEGLSGTSTNKREKFQEMINMAKRKKVDLILTKEVSRFSRNIQDLINIVSDLQKINVHIVFLSDDINTEDKDSIERLRNLGLAAEVESRRTSKRVRWGQAQQMKNGVVFGRKEMYGYNIKRDSKGKQYFEVIPEEAEIVKKVFQWFSEGEGTHRISKRLESEGISTKKYKNGWSNTVILRLLRNEKYVGDLLQGKTYTPDVMTHAKKYNINQSDKYYIKDHHPESAIIDRALWDKVQQRLKENEPSEEVKMKHSNRYWTSGKVFCGICNSRYVRFTKKRKNDIYVAWICFNHHQRGNKKEVQFGEETITVGCDAKRVNEQVLKIALRDIVTEYMKKSQEEIIRDVNKELQSQVKVSKTQIVSVNDIQTEIEDLQEKLASLTMGRINNSISEMAYNLSAKKLEAEIVKKQAVLDSQKVHETMKEEIEITKKDYEEQIKEICSLSDKDINEQLFERITKKIIVYPENVIEIYLSFLPRPIKMKYTTSGKGAEYDAKFTILN